MITRLVVNGCSYMYIYANHGKGHIDLARQLNMATVETLAQSGCNNSRILRTTIKDSYLTTQPTLYVLGMTFINRSEVTILKCGNENESFEGRWTNPQNQIFSHNWEGFWTESDTASYVKLKEKESLFGLLDYTEDLMYRMLSVINDLEARGHRVLMYQQADSGYYCHLDSRRLELLNSKKNIIEGFRWRAIPWQHSQGVPVNDGGEYTNKYGTTPEDIRHRKSGKHQILNEYLINYINEHKILE